MMWNVYFKKSMTKSLPKVAKAKRVRPLHKNNQSYDYLRHLSANLYQGDLTKLVEKI